MGTNIDIHGVYCLSNCACIEVHLEDGYDPFVMWRMSIVDGIKSQTWHKAKINETAAGRSYFRAGRMRIYLDNVERV